MVVCTEGGIAGCATSIGQNIYTPENIIQSDLIRYMRQAINILNLDRDGIEKVLPNAESIRSEFFDREVDIIFYGLMSEKRNADV